MYIYEIVQYYVFIFNNDQIANGTGNNKLKMDTDGMLGMLLIYSDTNTAHKVYHVVELYLARIK